jgi:hypothetical protein
MKASEKFEKMMRKRGIKVVCGKASDWIKSNDHARNWNQGSVGKRVAFSCFSEEYQAWIEPKISYASWAEAIREIPYIVGEK